MKKPETAKKETKTVKEAKVTSYEVSQVKMFDNGGIMFTLTINDITIYGCKVATTKDGRDFISWPSRKGADGKYYSHVFVKLSDVDSANILKKVEEILNQ